MLAASMHGQDITLSHLTVNGKALNVSAQGGMADQTLDLTGLSPWPIWPPSSPTCPARLDAKGHAGGKLNDLAVQADIGADLAAKGYSSGHITAKVDATGLPAAPHATVNADGTLLDAPLSLALTADETNGAFKVDISQASWKSLQAGGAVSLTPPAVIPAGKPAHRSRPPRGPGAAAGPAHCRPGQRHARFRRQGGETVADSARRGDARDGGDQQGRAERHRHRSDRPSGH